MAMPYARSTRRSFTIEFKAKVLQWYHDNGKNKHATAKNFKINRRNLYYLAREGSRTDEGLRREKEETTDGWKTTAP